MDLTWSPAEEAFRAEVRAWLEANLDAPDSFGDDEFDDDVTAFESRRAW